MSSRCQNASKTRLLSVIGRVLRRPQKSKSKALDSIAKTPVGGQLETSNQKKESHESSFLALPVDLILLITDFLEVDNQALLSLSCTALHKLLRNRLDLAMTDLTVRRRFLRSLEPDYPEYLPCDRCGMMFKWRKRRSEGYCCPCPKQVDAVPWPEPGSINKDRYNGLRLEKEELHLSFRAKEHGLQYGLHLSFVDDYLPRGIRKLVKSKRTNMRARFINGEFLVARRQEIQLDPENIVMGLYNMELSSFCRHFFSNCVLYYWERLEDVMDSTPPMGMSIRKNNCHFCATDAWLYISKSESGMLVVVDLRMNFGTRYDRDQACEQVFVTKPPELNANEAEGGNLHALFDAPQSK